MRAKLTPKQRFFIAQYQIDFNGTKAAIRAGFSKKNASEIAHQLLQKTPVKEAIQRDMEEHLRKLGVRAERVLEEVARIGFYDVRKLFNADGSLKSPLDWDPETAAAIAGFKIIEEFSGRGDDRKMIGQTKKIRFFDKVKALDLLMKHLMLYSTGDQKSIVKVHVTETKPAPLSTLELAAKIRYPLTIADERMKQKQLEDKSCEPQRPGKLPY